MQQTNSQKATHSQGYPSRTEAERLLMEALKINPGPWGDHSRVVALSAEKIAKTAGLDPEKAYILGLLHDIGRRYGRGHIAHVYGGCKDMLALGYPEVARICITHSYNNQDMNEEVSPEPPSPEHDYVEAQLMAAPFDDYDRLIQLCDSISMAEGVVPIEVRMNDVKRRYPQYPQPKWDKNLALKAYFEEKCGANLYAVLGEEPLGIRPSRREDLPEMLRIYEHARSFMAASGNPRQWSAEAHHGIAWPPESVLIEDIRVGRSYVCLAGDHVVATFCYLAGPDPTYARIDGAWLSDTPYPVVHRIASDGSRPGIGTFCLTWACRNAGHLRIDTHRDNRPMQHLLQKCGFRYCGIIFVEEDDDPRLAFEFVPENRQI